MEAAIIKVSSKGQIVIPAAWRKRMGIKDGEELLAIGDEDTLVIKKIEKTSLKKEFKESASKARKKAKKLGITKKDVKNAVMKARET